MRAHMEWLYTKGCCDDGKLPRWNHKPPGAAQYTVRALALAVARWNLWKMLPAQRRLCDPTAGPRSDFTGAQWTEDHMRIVIRL